jgi:hypothetical protein
MEEIMSATQMHDAKFFTIWWDEKTRIVGIEGKR